MLFTLHCLGACAVLFLLAPPTTSFSGGASHASCQEMIPGHIRAHSQDRQHRYVTIRTSASSYLPGQFITVMVRRSRDFMGFLLQARSAEGTFRKSGGGFGDKPRPTTGAGSGVTKSRRGGPVLVGGSWILTPPGTHTLCCLSEGDTVTHSDKQLKRNLSFVWRAPDSPVGDIRFYITVVQSYFVYWAGIESAVVRDASRRLWSGSNSTGVNGVSAIFALLQDKVTTLPTLRAFKASNKEINETDRPDTTLQLSTSTRSEPYNNKSMKTPTETTHPALDRSSSVTLASLEISKKKNMTLEYLQNGSQTPLGSFSGVTLEAQIDPVLQPKDRKSSSPLTASFSSAVATGMKTTTISSSNNTVQASSSPLPLLVSVIPLKEKELPKLNLSAPKLPDKPEIEDTTITKAISSTNHSFHNIKFPRPTSQNPKRTMQEEKGSAKFKTQSGSVQPHRTSVTESQTNSVKSEIGIRSQNPHPQTSSPKPFSHFEAYTPILLLRSQTSTSHNYPFPSASSSKYRSRFQTSSPHSIPPSKYPITESFLASHTVSSLTHSENSPFESKSNPKQTSTPFSKLQTTATVLSSSPHREYIRTFHQDMPETTPTKSQGQTSIPWTDYSQSEIPPEVSSTSPQPRSQPVFQIGQKQTPSSKSLFNPLLFTLRTDRTPTLDKGQVDLKSEAKIRTTSPVFGLPSATPSLSTSLSSHLDSSSFFSSSTLPTTETVHDRSTTSPHASGGSTLVTMHPSIRSTFFIPSSSFTRNQPTTSPARSALPSPSPISSPTYLSSSQPTPTSPQPSSFASSTIPYLYSSNHPLSDLLFTPAPLPTFTSSKYITNSINSFVSSTTSSSSTSATSSSYQGTSSFYIPSVTFPPKAQSTSLHPGPSPAPRRSLYNLSMPSPSQKRTEGHTASSDPYPSIHPPTPRTDIHSNPKPHPNIKENLGHELKPNLPNSDAKHPSSPPATPDKEGKYPDIPRHSAWELGMLLGSSAGLGMVLVVGIRYMYHQACGKRTEVTLNDREREYGRGEIGLIHVQECGDLVRVRKIRENSLVLLAEYDVLSPPGERNAGCQQRC